jgi:alpha-beta hydrolase superfamily lysophospholipase
MKVHFEDRRFSFQLLRVLGQAVQRGSDVGECLATAQRIREGDFESWHGEWQKTARRMQQTADDSLEKHRASATECYLRAASYYRAAGFHLSGDPADPRIRETSAVARECFWRFVELSGQAVERLQIPYQGSALPAYFYPGLAKGEAPTAPALIVQAGFDATQEELFGTAMAAVRRGFHCLTFEGPGQGMVLREQGLPLCHDWEKVVTPVVDALLARPEVDPKQVALLGYGLGGYLVPRAAAFERRLAVIIANGGVFDLLANHLPKGTTRDQLASMARSRPDQLRKEMDGWTRADPELRWAVSYGMYAFGAASVAEYVTRAAQCSLAGVVEKITCPTLVVDNENEWSFRGQADRLYEALRCPKTFMLFTAEEGAEEPCQTGASMLSDQSILDWLDETLAERQDVGGS